MLRLATVLSLALVAGCFRAPHPSDFYDPHAESEPPGAGRVGDAALGTSDGGSVGVGGNQDVAIDGAGPQPTWSSCPTPWSATTECLVQPLPLNWSAAGGAQIPVLVGRIRAKVDRRGQLWLLNGGPGGPGADMEPFAQMLAGSLPDLDIYMPDHRGTGASARLGCAAEEAGGSEGGASITVAEWPKCLATVETQWGFDLAHFTTTAAARDVHGLIEATRAPGDEVFIYGASYGTYWAHRYVQLYPAEPTGVVLDSVCAPGVCLFDRYDVEFDGIAKRFFDECGKDPACNARAGPDPWQRLVDLRAKLQAGHCPQLATKYTPAALRQVLAGMLTVWQLRHFAPAVMMRLDRCAPSDVLALNNLHAALMKGSDPTVAGGFSAVLLLHVAFSELRSWPPPPMSQILADFEATHVSPGTSLLGGTVYGPWPKYPDDEWTGQWADSAAPMLILNGLLDPQTTELNATAAAEHFQAPNQHLVLVPGAAHGVIAQSPTASGGHCGFELIRGFLTAPLAPLEDGCLDDLLPAWVEPAPQWVQLLFGGSDLWDGPGKTDAIGSLPPPADWPEVRERFERVRRQAGG